MFIINQKPYPLFVFPPRIYEAVRETIELVQVTDVIAATSCLTALSIGVGPLVDWRHPLSGQIRPSVLCQAIIAISGDRKSSAEELVCGPIYDHDVAGLLARDSEIKAYSLARQEWVAIRKELVRRIGKQMSSGKPTESLEAEVVEHEANEPKKPDVRRMVYQDMTRTSAFEALEGDGKAIALLTDEGQTLLNSTVMRHYGFLNNCFEGKRLLTYDRANHQSIIVQNPRVTISFMVQPDVLTEFFSKRGKIVHGSGFCARYLFSRSPSIQGQREPRLSKPLVHLVPFHNRLRQLLDRYRDMRKVGNFERGIIEFEDSAKLLWLEIAAKVERDFTPGFYLHDISDFGNKYMDMVGRIACLLHYFENEVDNADDAGTTSAPIKTISSDTLSRASVIAEWHLHEYKAMFSQTLNPLPQELDARRLYNYLYRTFFLRNIHCVEKNAVRQCGGVRGGRFDAALGQLQAWFAIGMSKTRLDGAKKETEVIQLYPAYFQNNAIY